MPAALAVLTQQLELPLAVLLLLYAALHDIAARTIPNPVPAVLAALGLALRLLEDSLWPSLLAATFLALALTACRMRGWMGGGDVKLLSALALLLRPGQLAAAIVAIAWCGVALALPYLLLRGRIAAPAPRRPAGLPARIARIERARLRRGGPLPYGVAIAAGGILALVGR